MRLRPSRASQWPICTLCRLRARLEETAPSETQAHRQRTGTAAADAAQAGGMSIDAAITKLGKLAKLTSSAEACALGIAALEFWKQPWYVRVVKAMKGFE